MNRFCNYAVIVVASIFLTNIVRADDWPSFRGPLGNAVSAEKKVPVNWDADTNVKWKTPLPRPANGSPIVSNGQVFVTSALDDEGHERSLLSFDRTTGKQLWMHTAKLDKTMQTHKTNPYCGSTPAANGEVVVVWHSSAGLFCVDFSGKEVWSRQLGEFEHIWGYGTSPVLYGDSVILHSGPGERIFIASFDLKTGETKWEHNEAQEGKDSGARADGKYKGSWCTPIIHNVDGIDQVICTMPTRVIGLDADEGKVIWSCDGIYGPKGSLSYSSPIVCDDVLVAIGGFQGPGIGIKLAGSGNVTDSHRLWRNEKNPQSIGSGVFVDGYIYRPNAGPGTLECFDPKTGEVLWTERSGNSWGSIVYVAERCYLTNQDGTTIVFKPTPKKYEEIAKNELKEPSNSTPAVSDGEIFIRTAEHLYCVSD